LFVSLAESKQVTLSFTAQPGELLTYFDPDKLEKILYNLLSNACKFTPAGGNISVQVSVQQTTGENIFVSDNAGPVIVIRVQDTGIGIGAESLNKIFDRFYQVDSSQTRAFEGLGIGLALTKELIELQRGTISVRSEEGKGTCFTVTLPLLAIQPEDLTVPGSGTATEMPGKAPILVPLHPAVQPDNLSLRKVNPPVNPDDPTPLMLIVEDNADLRQYIVNTFSENYRVLEARDGLEGLNTAIEHIPDIIISDLMMPQLDGLSLCAKLKTDERTSHIPVILLTARTSMQSKMAGLENGADDYLTKPFYAEEVEVRVRNLIQQRRKLRERFSLSAVVEPAEAVLNSADERFLTSLNTVIEDNIADPAMDIEFLEKEIGLSRVQLYRKLKALTDQAPIEYIRNIRLQRAGVLLAQQYGNISEVAYKVGFNNLSYFTKCFRQHYGMTPSEYILSHSDVHSSE
jgi:DNA-binding response OmpR family regulator